MKAMVLKKIGTITELNEPLEQMDVPIPNPGPGEILIKVSACGVCHTELDEIEGRAEPTKLPIILGHQVVGRIQSIGDRAGIFEVGDRVGVAWIYSACGSCGFCSSGFLANTYTSVFG